MFLAFHDMNLYNILYKYDKVTKSLRKATISESISQKSLKKVPFDLYEFFSDR